MAHQPVTTLAEFDALDPGDVIDGYQAARLGDPEPGGNRSRAYWHGWCVYQMAVGTTPTPRAFSGYSNAWPE
jgi:hypothetical protein